ncbi:MAG: phosphoenolpyruvate--protein phosphotransferase [Desulfovibrio sp.]|jgi:phosphotransferase system enzyme I (PtsI)|nr:phosphoenolpyruvate--protein phosphotransferase [Desulfovibrio sp.]
MVELQGIGGAPGCAIGVAVVKNAGKTAPERRIIDDPAEEIERFHAARDTHMRRLESLYTETLDRLGEKEAGIFKAHQIILQDEYFFGQALERVTKERVAVDYAIEEEKRIAAAAFAEIDDEYLRERFSDIETVCHELICILNDHNNNFASIPQNAGGVILVAEELTPADTVRMDKDLLRGLLTEKGGSTSHTVILARALGIPAIVGVRDLSSQIKNGHTVILDGGTGQACVNPTRERLRNFKQTKLEEDRRRAGYEKAKREKAVTLDGRVVRVNVNTGDADSLRNFDKDVCDGVGLFRTEFLYMDHADYPTEEEQSAVYRDMAEKAGGKEVIIRTLDIGGDKQLGYMCLPEEDNPFLGYRAIRICLDRPAVFNAQLRAILRASVYGDVKIMFPMIVSLDEVRAAKAATKRAMDELRAEGIPFNKDIKQGIMIETPASVFISDQLARNVDFFSIGSNDLIQYVTASDRMNDKIQHIYDSCNVSVLRAIRIVADNAAKAGIPVGICGEVASEARLIPLWAALGIAELSVAPAFVGRVKYVLRRTSAAKTRQDLESLFDCESADEARALLDKILAGIID